MTSTSHESVAGEARTNGDLLDLAEAEGYRVVVSTDKGIPYQQKLEGRQIGVVVVLARPLVSLPPCEGVEKAPSLSRWGGKPRR